MSTSDEPSTPSWRPANAIHSARVPRSSSPPVASAVTRVPPVNERGPRQNSPPYPAFFRPFVVGDPNAIVSPLTLVIVVSTTSDQAPTSMRCPSSPPPPVPPRPPPWVLPPNPSAPPT